MPPPVSFLVPFPCVVYTRDRPGGVYTFSHHSAKHTRKTLPASLRVSDLKAYNPLQNISNWRNSCFLVLVAGDVARCVSVATVHTKQVRFLYHGSSYSIPDNTVDRLQSEFNEGYIPLHMYGTLTTYTVRGGLHSLVAIESGVCLFPRQIKEDDIPRLGKWIEAALLRSIHSSVWMTNVGHSYNEFNLAHTANRDELMRNTPPAAATHTPSTKRQRK